jgi:hypothetical protein
LPFPSLVCPIRAHQSISCAAGAPLPSTRGSIAPCRSPSVSEFALEVSTLSMPLFRQVSPQNPHNCSSELVAPPQDFSHRGLRSLVPPCRLCAHGCVRRVALNVPHPFPTLLEPHRGCPLVSSEPSLWDRAAPPRLCRAPGRWILNVRPRSGGLDFS